MSDPALSAADVRLGLREKAGYGLGDMASNLSFGAVSLFLLFFYTNIFGLSAGEASLIFLIARIIDALFNILLGYAIDRTHSRHGKLRPYLLYGALPLGVLTVLCFSTPDTSYKFAYALVSYTLYCLAYTTVNTPYSAMNNMLTQHTMSRASLSVYRMLFATLGYFVVSVYADQLIRRFADPRTGYQLTIALFAGLATLLFYACFAMTRERIRQDEDTAPSLRQMVQAITANRPLFQLSMFTVFTYIAYSVWMAAAIYYINYVLRDEAYTASFFAIQTVANLVGTIASEQLIARFGKKRLTLLTLSAGALALACQYWLAGDNRLAIMACVSVYSAAMGSIFVCMYAMLADTVEYAEWQHHVRTEGAIYGYFNFITKVAMAIAGGLAGLILQYAGYDAAHITPRAQDWIALMMTLIPAALFVLALLFMLRYALDENSYRHMLGQIAARKQPAAAQPQET
ncbi:MFS transporter [Aquitalea pelogenes]|uniref:MFS transporter n=1 Tax=Aquitalea pelogenes TaxID=1293573 RepID=UPI0035ADF1B3